jgi:transcription initiation factor TFIIH subunit 1
VTQRPGAPVADSHVFNFTSPTAARAEQTAITEGLRVAIEAVKARTHAQITLTGTNGGGKPEALAIAQAVSAGKSASDGSLDDSRLKADVELQRSLLSANPVLRKIFEQALQDKPDTISVSQFAAQFWSARLHMLRSHAAERSQAHGPYNVLSEVKPKNVDGTTRLNLSKEQIQLIFNQHPLVKQVYDECVPRLSERDFWARFFGSRLFKKLKGEKIIENDSTDPVLDKYLKYDENAKYVNEDENLHVPHFMDLEGNEQNHSQRKGNQPDLTMRPNSYEKVPILRVLNSMSEKMLAQVPPSDLNLHDPAGMDEETYNEVRLQDLQRERVDNRVRLNIKDQRFFFAGEASPAAVPNDTGRGDQLTRSSVANLYRDLDASTLLYDAGDGLNLEKAIDVQLDSDSDEDDVEQRESRVGSRKSLQSATSDIFGAIRERRSDIEEAVSGATGGATTKEPVLGLPPAIFESVMMTHSTTVEFLHYFWTVFLSGEPERANELQKLVETLDKSLERLNAIANTAEEERSKQLDAMRKRLEEFQQRTGKKRKLDPSSIQGGAKAVQQLTAPAVNAINTAVKLYRKALEEQMGQLEA